MVRLFDHHVNVSAAVSQIVKAAGVVVRPGCGQAWQPPTTSDPSSPVLTTCDVRSATRWARDPRFSVAQLKTLMRHSDIATTMRYYVDDDAENLAELLYANSQVTVGQKPSWGTGT